MLPLGAPLGVARDLTGPRRPCCLPPAAAPEAALLQQARSRHALSGGLPEEARRRRLVGWLQRRGHKWADISQIMRQLEKEAAAAALDRLGDEGRGDDRSAASNWEEVEERL